MPSQKIKTFWLGMFFVLGTAIVIAGLIWLGASKWFQETRTYVTYFDTSVQGLNVDAAVRFRGVQVGRVSDIRVAPDGYLIEVVMELDPALFVADSLRAKVELTGITGIKYIELNYVGPEKMYMHPELPFEPHHPVIPCYPAGFAEIEQALREIYDKLVIIDTEGISFRIKTFLDAGTELAVSADSLISRPGFTAWSDNLNRTVSRADSMIGRLDFAAYNAEVEKTLAELHQGARNFNEFSAKLKEQSEGLQVPTQLATINENMNNLLLTTSEMVGRFQYQSSQVMSSISTTMKEMNETIAHLNALVMSVEAYPSNLLYTGPPPKEK